MTESDGLALIGELIALLDLERLEDNLFRGVSPEASPVRVFGGQVAAQALVAAGRTVPADRQVHSLHAYFLRPGDPAVPIVYEVDRTRDGRSFTTRRVVAIQHGKPIFTMSSSFQVAEPGLEHADPMPAVAAPESVPSLADRLTRVDRDSGFWARVKLPFDIRYLVDPPWLLAAEGGTPAPQPDLHVPVWFRVLGSLPADPLLHVCVLAYLSDLTLLESVTSTHGVSTTNGIAQMASLDHAMWLHRPIRLDDWVLYYTSSPSATGARGLSTGQFFAADGTLLATVVQEGLIRLR